MAVKIAITPEQPLDDEPAMIVTALTVSGFDIVHLRHPSLDESTTRSLIEALPADLRPRLRLHDHHQLAERLGVGGIHLNSRNPRVPEGYCGAVSMSCHNRDDLQLAVRLHCQGCRVDYVFLSPVFDSISKPGYRAAFPHDELASLVDLAWPLPVIALGGITPNNIHSIRDIGFAGYAMLSAAWKPCHPITL